ncbi:AAA domain-containing protein [Algoriphagus sp. D3-2-R+10]|uniref:AAA domain-containing protein n=1 Tax=Algoriphagus aurantiacus TaxID=3103948 RepID=UPI002B3F6EF3|nr:AAA domain-containing protein [Algoriphagus sp. D3-2-R+10]MEB2776321.1 AAA domain-containing protein [Algoriphagus sp. D3-2-R+10]
MPESIFQTYRHRLIDLSSKNRSLYLPKSEGFGVVDLKELDFLNGENSFEIIRRAISSKNTFPLIPESDPRLASVNSLSKTFSRLSFRDQLTKEETGEGSLFLGWPFVEGKLINGHVLRAPLLLLSVGLQIENGQWVLSKINEWQWSPAFLLAYSQGYGKVLDADALNQALQELSTDATEFRTEFSKILNDNFSIQLSSSLFEDQLIPFPVSQLSLDSGKFQDGKLALKSYALLGLFAQKANFLFSDYEKLEDEFSDIDLEELFIKYYETDENQSIPREDQLFPVFPLDASQENILMKVRQGRSLVVEGPPGTGKSQLIANLVSDYCSRGKKVLVVSQKRAALDVVFERLSKAGFGDFLGLVHDFRADQKVLFQKIKAQIEAIESYQEQNRGIDSIQLEREISQYSKAISRLSEKFEGFRTALFDTESAGIPVKAMYLNADLKKPFFDHPDLTKLDYQKAQDFEKDYKIHHSYSLQFKGSFWEKRVSFSHFEPVVFPRIVQSLNEIETSRVKWAADNSDVPFEKLASLILATADFPDSIKGLNDKLNQLEKPELAILSIFDSKNRLVLTKVCNWISASIEKLQQLSFGISASSENLSSLELELDALKVKTTSWLGKMQVQLNKDKFPLTFEILDKSNLKLDSKAISGIRAELETLKALNTELVELPKMEGMEITKLSTAGLENQLELLSPVLDWIVLWENRQELHSLACWTSDDFKPQLNKVRKFSESFQQSSINWKAYLNNDQIFYAFNNGTAAIGTELNLNQTFSELVAFDRFLEKSHPITISLAEKLETEYPALSLSDQLLAFWNSWYLAWIAYLEAKSPLLAEAGSLAMQHELVELKGAILEKRKIARHIALLRLREQITSGLEFNRLGNRLTYRDLLHQVSKKRQRWPIRRLLEEMGEEVFRLLPCWFASPETVSAVFSLEQNFDLVIFDEASQCHVERGLPAMLRGKQVVIAGDSKQLRPSDFYQVKWESEEEGLEYEAESLLELAGDFFEKHQLKGHYRSADPALIHFSNEHFYENQLEALPDYVTTMVGKPAFTWEKVEGIWFNQVNKMEVDAVVLKVERIRHSSPSDSIGVVTGNYFQMELIREKLWKAGFQDSGIKVRNIENVQGDEFDQVILSLGYAPNPDGKLVTNFGLLGKSGAENRLNVAITRARKRMHVISSIEPADFRPSQLKNQGLAMLREFLTFAQIQSGNPSIATPTAITKGYEIYWSLKNKLLDLDKSYSKETPSAVMDLILTESSGEKKAVLTDDQRFFNAATAKAALAYHPILLEQKGWIYEWKWSRNYFYL